MNRLRNKIVALFLFVVVAGVVSATYATTRNFAADKKEYLMVLNSVAAPNIASAMGKHLDHLQSQLVIFDEILDSIEKTGKSADLLQSTFQTLSGVLRLGVYDSKGLVASIGGSVDPDTEQASDSAILEKLHSNRIRILTAGAEPKDGGKSFLIFGAQVRKRVYVARVESSLFDEYFDSVKALSVMLVTDEGKMAHDNHNLAMKSLPPSVTRELVSSQSLRGKQAVIAKELRSSDGGSILAAISPVPDTQGMVVVIRTPSAQISQLIAAVMSRSIPMVVIILISAVLMAFVFSTQLVRPIEELTEATSRIAHGDWNVSIKRKSNDEVGRLIDAFNHMGAELAHREEELKKANEQLVRSERLAVLGKFGAGIAHEVKNPLNSILGYAQLIQKRFPPATDETIKKYLGFIMDETRRASRIITDLLTFARQKTPQLYASKVSDFVDYAYEMIQPQASASKVTLIKNVQDAHVEAKMDRDQLFQVILNLSNNSIQAMEEKQANEERKLILHLSQADGYVVLDVEDNGTGISEENLKRMFEPFFSTKGVGKGTGLGLSLCHGIIQQHNGKIEVTSKFGVGTKFRIFLPIHRQGQAQTAAG